MSVPRAVAAGAAAVALVAAILVGDGAAGGERVGDDVPASPDGAALFQARGCAACHTGPDSTSALGGGFPDLSDAAAWAGDRRPGTNAEEYLAESMLAPDAFRAPGTGSWGTMPDLGLTAAEVDALVDYLLDR